MERKKDEKQEYDVCYNLPLALSIPFQSAADSDQKFTAYEYKISIPEESLKFSLITPVYIGDLFQVAQKSGVVLANGDRTTVRQKVLTTPPASIELTAERLISLQAANVAFWKALNPGWNKSMEVFAKFPASTADLQSDGYRSLRKQYLITNEFIDDNFCKTSNKSGESQLSFQEIKANLDSIYLNLTDKVHCQVIHAFGDLSKLTLNEFARGIFEVLFPTNRPEVINPYKDLMSFMMTELEVRKEDIIYFGKSLRDYSVSLGNRALTKDIAKAVRSLDWSLTTADHDLSLCVTVPATKFGSFDHNKYDGIIDYEANMSIKQARFRDYKKLGFLASSEIQRTPFKLDDLDKCLRIIPTLIQIERIAQIREFKLLMDFGFMKDHLLLKALNARAIDKCNNNETLETLGDTVLKTLVTVNLFFKKGNKTPNEMTKEKVEYINNRYLAIRGKATPLLFYLKDKYQKTKDFIPPFLTPISKKTSDSSKDNKPIYDESQILADDMIADSVEALIGNL